jgi:hypothetical protein
MCWKLSGLEQLAVKNGISTPVEAGAGSHLNSLYGVAQTLFKIQTTSSQPCARASGGERGKG